MTQHFSGVTFKTYLSQKDHYDFLKFLIIMRIVLLIYINKEHSYIQTFLLLYNFITVL